MWFAIKKNNIIRVCESKTSIRLGVMKCTYLNSCRCFVCANLKEQYNICSYTFHLRNGFTMWHQINKI